MPNTRRLRLAVVTTSRADFGIYHPVLTELAASEKVALGLIVTGMHLSPAFGLTAKEVRASGFDIWAEVPSLVEGDDARSIATSCGATVQVVAGALADCKPDLVMVLGDRFEMMGATLAAYMFRVPILHIHGGDETIGSFDNGFRHAISKLSHLHFTATALASRRVLQMGEAPEHVIQTGAPGLDALARAKILDKRELLQRVGLREAPYLLVTYHAETIAEVDVEKGVEQLWQALAASGLQLLVTASNADTGGRTINRMLAERCQRAEGCVFVQSLGHELYASAMRHAEAMVGNSSSGIIEAAHFRLPVVNIGDRQRGRERSANVIDCAADADSIRRAVQRACSTEFRRSISDLVNVYGDGRAAQRIRSAVEAIADPRAMLVKRFHLLD